MASSAASTAVTTPEMSPAQGPADTRVSSQVPGGPLAIDGVENLEGQSTCQS